VWMALMCGLGGACGNSAAKANGGAGSGGGTVDGAGETGSAGTSDATAGTGGSAVGSGRTSGDVDANADAQVDASTDGVIVDAMSDDGSDDENPSSTSSCGRFRMPNPASTGLPNPPSYTTNADGTVTDNVTGLVWEGTVGPDLYMQADAILHCATKGGAWRLPAALELASLVDYTIPAPGPTIDQEYFPNAPAEPFWTSSRAIGVLPSGPPQGWSVGFIGGGTGYEAVTTVHRARCVNEPTPQCYSPPYQVLAGGLVYDRATGLTWQQTTDASSYTWSSALTHCAGLGAGWRAPSMKELQTIVNYGAMVGQDLDGIVLANPVPPLSFWSSTPCAAIPTEAGFVDYTGLAGFTDATNTFMVRCVR
jgi:hypothetical protein